MNKQNITKALASPLSIVFCIMYSIFSVAFMVQMIFGMVGVGMVGNISGSFGGIGSTINGTAILMNIVIGIWIVAVILMTVAAWIYFGVAKQGRVSGAATVIGVIGNLINTVLGTVCFGIITIGMIGISLMANGLGVSGAEKTVISVFVALGILSFLLMLSFLFVGIALTIVMTKMKNLKRNIRCGFLKFALILKISIVFLMGILYMYMLFGMKVAMEDFVGSSVAMIAYLPAFIMYFVLYPAALIIGVVLVVKIENCSFERTENNASQQGEQKPTSEKINNYKGQVEADYGDDAEGTMLLNQGQGNVDSIPQPVRQNKPQGRILCVSGREAGVAYPIVSGEEIIIGKDPRYASIVVGGEYTKVSRRHCGVKFDGVANCYFVIDYSSNGTIVRNHQKLTKDIYVRVARGSEICLATEDTVYRLE